MIYTIEYLKKAAEGICGAWNGSDSRFTYEGEIYTDEAVGAAKELIQKLAEIEELIEELNL